MRTEEGRLLVGLAGDRVLALSFVDVLWKLDSMESSAGESPPFSWWGNTPDRGVGCEDSGPLPGVGGRGVSGGESGGAGIEVPSVREKLMGVSVSGWYLSAAMVFGCSDGLGRAINWTAVTCKSAAARRRANVAGPQSGEAQGSRAGTQGLTRLLAR